MSECSICYETVIDHPAPAATGSHRSSCGHVYHPKCIWTWYSTQPQHTCPMCRKPATEMEDAPGEDDGAIRVTRIGMDYILRTHGAIGVTAEMAFDEYDEVTITRSSLQDILDTQGGNDLSDAQWSQLQSVYPAEDDDAVVGGAMALAAAAPRLTFTTWEPEPLPEPEPEITAENVQHARDILASTGPIAPEDAEAWALVQDAARSTLARHAPGPFDVEDEPRITLTRARIEQILQRLGSSSTATEFFNEEDGEDTTLVVTMTHASIEARFASLGHAVEFKGRILNPEDE